MVVILQNHDFHADIRNCKDVRYSQNDFTVSFLKAYTC